MILTFRPIKVWPESFNREALDRNVSPFSGSYSDTLVILDRELEALGASNVVLQVDATERDCRADGQLRADAKVKHPGVILSFDTSRHGTLTYATDRFQARYGGQSWQHNLRAIALGLEALRKVERYGIAERGQQYAGYREIGSGIELGAARLSVEQAVEFLAEHSGWPGYELEPTTTYGYDDVLADAYRAAAKKLHPDVGGDPELFKRLTEARDVLDDEHERIAGQS